MPAEKLNLQQLAEQLEFLVEQGRSEDVRLLIADERPEDVAEALLELESSAIRLVLTWVDAETASQLVQNIDDDYWNELLTPLARQRLVEILEELPSDDAADLLTELDDEISGQILEEQSDNEEFRHVTALLQYPEDTAGALMNPDIVYVQETLNTDEALNIIRRNIESFKDINYIFITNAEARLTGVLPLPILISSGREALLREIMLTDLISVDVFADQDEVVDTVRKYELTTLPVIDSHQHLMGIITIDDVLDVIEEQSDEDVYKMAGLGEDPEAQGSALKSAFARIPWLLLCLGGSMVAGKIIHIFEPTLERLLVLASFMPAVMGMAGNSGLQTSTLMIRNLVTGPSLRDHLWQLIRREMGVALVIGSVCGICAGIMAQVLFEGGIVGLVVGLSMFISILFSTCLGIILPLLLDKTGIDPAVASGPLIATLNDSTAITIYLGLGTLMLVFFTKI